MRAKGQLFLTEFPLMSTEGMREHSHHETTTTVTAAGGIHRRTRELASDSLPVQSLSLLNTKHGSLVTSSWRNLTDATSVARSTVLRYMDMVHQTLCAGVLGPVRAQPYTVGSSVTFLPKSVTTIQSRKDIG